MDPQIAAAILDSQLTPWKNSIADPKQAQQQVLQRLLKDYANTRYGETRGAAQIETLDAYRQAFPISTYEDYLPLIQQVMRGDTESLLSDPPVGWAITRGSTQGQSKFIPMTAKDLAMRISAGRAMMNYVSTTQNFDLFEGVNLNLNFPSVVGALQAGDRQIEYGYSSGIYTKYVSTFTPICSVPSQDEIDALGGGKTLSDWEKRFELAYQKCKQENVTLVGGVCPTTISFAQFLRKKYRRYPKDVWKTQIMTLGSVPGINTHYSAALKALYGPVAIREIYGTTEGMFGQQLDEKRAWAPNYDLFFFEVLVGSQPKMLHEMRAGEVGSLVVSTPILPRYRIGDLILAYEAPYFRCIGRERWWTPIHYAWNEFSSFNFGRL